MEKHFFTCGCPIKNICLQFLERHDHEGSSIDLMIYEDDQKKEYYNNEEIYKLLGKE